MRACKILGEGDCHGLIVSVSVTVVEDLIGSSMLMGLILMA